MHYVYHHVPKIEVVKSPNHEFGVSKLFFGNDYVDVTPRDVNKDTQAMHECLYLYWEGISSLLIL